LEVFGKLAGELDEITGELASLNRGPMEALREAVGRANMLPVELGFWGTVAQTVDILPQ
jgi:hypothetical protein